MADFKLTPEQAKALRGLAPFSKDAVHKFTPPSFKKDVFPEELRPIFHLKPLSRAAKKDMVRKGLEMSKADEKDVDLDAVKDLIRPFITNIERLFDIGSQGFVEYRTDEDGTMSKDLFFSIPNTVINEVTDEMMLISGLKEPEALGLK